MISDIVLLNRREGGWFSSCQRFFTKMPYTHCTFSVGNVLGHESVLSSEEKIVIIPLHSYFTEEEKETDIEIYRINTALVPEYTMKNLTTLSIPTIYYKTANQYYGFIQTVWFVYRWFMGLFGKDVRKKINPFKNGIICSELVYMLLHQIYLINTKHFSDLGDTLNEFTPDTIHAGDIANILNSSPYFKLVYKKIKGEVIEDKL